MKSLCIIYPNFQVYESQKQCARLTKSQLSEISVAKMLLCVVGVFGICTAPVIIKAIVKEVSGQDFVRPSDAGELETYYSHTILRIIHWLGIVVNSSVNFMIYCTMSTSFRKSLFSLYNQILRNLRGLLNSSSSASAASPTTKTTDEPSSSMELSATRVPG